MATYLELQERSAALIQDPSLTNLIASLLNQGVQEIAGGMQSAFGDIITPPLPKLFTIGSVTTVTDAAYVSMPATFQRNLQLAVTAAGYVVDIANSFIEFTETYPALDRSGSISEVVEFGGNIYYQGIPTSAEDLTVHFYRLPVAMSDDDDTPDGIPLYLQIPLLVNYTAWKAYEFIEDGLEGETPNTTKYLTFFMQALKNLELSIPNDIRGLQLR